MSRSLDQAEHQTEFRQDHFETPAEPRAVAKSYHRTMELDVVVRHGPPILSVASGYTVHRPAPHFRDSGVAVYGKQYRAALYRGPGTVNVDHSGFVRLSNEHAPVGNVCQELLGTQEPEGLPQGISRNAEPGGHQFLDKFLAGSELSTGEKFPQPVGCRLRQR